MLVEKAFRALYPHKPLDFVPSLKYSGKFKGYRANIRKRGHSIVVSLSNQWKDVSPDIQAGLVQELFVRLFKEKAHTLNMDLYHSFIKNLASVTPKHKTHPVLEESFRRINKLQFDGILDVPNFALSSGTNILGTYEYAIDTITISDVLLAKPWLLDYVMFHEMLHKHHKYSAKNGRARHHTTQFRNQEKAYPNAALLEQELSRLVSAEKRRRAWRLW